VDGRCSTSHCEFSSSQADITIDPEGLFICYLEEKQIKGHDSGLPESEFQASLCYCQALYLAIGPHCPSSKTALQAVHDLAFACLLTSSSASSDFFFLHSAMLHHRAECCRECSIHALPVDGLISFFRSCLQRGLGSVAIPLLLILVVGCYFCTTYRNFNYTYVFIYIL